MGNRPASAAWAAMWSIAAALAFVAAAAGSAETAETAETPTLHPGRYEVVSEIQLPGLSMSPRTELECLTPERVRDLRRVVFREDALVGCVMSEPVIAGGQLTFVSVCSDDDGTERTTRTELEIGVDSFSGVMRTESEERTTVVRLRGRRIGACPP